MNCKQVRRFLYCFADGELSVKDNCEVLDHLKMCPPCARTVDDQQALRRALGGSMQSESAPPQLLERLHASLRQDVSVPPSASGRVLAFPRRRWAMAATFLLAATLGAYGWRYATGGTGGNDRTVINTIPVADEVVSTHSICCNHTRKAHQSGDLPDTLEGLRDAAAVKFGATMEVFVPDLANAGFHFESANRCGIEKGRPGLHLIYSRESDNARLSFFSVPRCKLNCRGFCNRGHRAYYVDARERQGTKLTVAGWQCSKGRSSFLACAPLPEEDMLNLLEVVRMADAGDAIPVIERAQLALLEPRRIQFP